MSFQMFGSIFGFGHFKCKVYATNVQDFHQKCKKGSIFGVF